MELTWKSIRKCIIVLFGSIALGFLMLLLVYCIPIEPIKQNVFASSWLLEEEGTYSEFLPRWFIRMHPDNIDLRTMLLNNRGMARDNHTDSLMLSAAAFDDADRTSILQKTLLVYHDEVVPLAPYNSLLAYSKTGMATSPVAYPRYWHGYLVVLKPLLLVLTYGRVRCFNILVLSLLIFALVNGIWKYVGKKETVAFVLAVLMTFPFVIPNCMQYSNMAYITLIAGNFMVYLGTAIWDKRKMLYFWLILGIVTAYFDFLTYPVMALGVALVLQEVIIKDTTWTNIITSIGVWLFGYAGMWSSKWILAELLTEEHVISDALSQVIHRTVGESDMSGRKANALTAVAANLSCYTNVLFLVLILICFIVFLCNMRDTRIIMEDDVRLKRNMHLLWIALLPFGWYALTASHSFDHSSYTYRSVMVTVFALLVFSCECRAKVVMSDSKKTN